MNKAEQAIIRYEKARQHIIDLSTEIGQAGQHYIDSEGNGGGSKCSDRRQRDSGFFIDTCIERYWQENKAAMDAFDEYDVPIEPEHVDLCPSCTEVDRLVIERKQARRHFGHCKVALSNIGKGLIKGG